jgi:FkbM family methyltransferase
MKEVIKKIIPRKMIVVGFDLITFGALIFCSFKFRPLVLRKKTSDWNVFKAIFVRGEFKLPINIKPKLIVDAGAYTGLSTLYFLSKYPLAKIIAVEPEQSNFNLLESQTEKFPQVTRLRAGLWSRNTSLKVIDRGLDKWGFGVRETSPDEQFDVKAVTVDHLLEISGVEKIDILKLDIEGSEKQLFSSNYESWLPKVNVIIIELHDDIIDGCTTQLYSSIQKNEWIEYKKGEKIILVRKNII